MASISRTTKDHDEIRSWAEARGGRPAHVAKTGSKDDIGILRVEFPGAPGSKDANLEEISWEQFFEKFDERGLAFLYQEETAGGEKSNFNKIVSSETAEEVEEGGRAASAGKGSTGRSARARSGVARKAAPAKKGSRGVASRATAKTTSGSRSAAGSSRPAKKAAAKKSVRAVAGKKAAKTASRRVSAKKTAGRKASPRATGRRPAAKKSAARKRR